MAHFARYGFHFLVNYIIWFVCIIYAARNFDWMGTIIAIVLILSQVFAQHVARLSWRKEMVFAMIVMGFGIVIDSLLMHLGWISFRGNLFDPYLSPPWMACLWLSFGFTMTVASPKWWQQPLWMGASIFFLLPFAYWLGAQFGAAFIHSTWFYVMLGGIWMLLLPNLFKVFYANLDKS